jgi:predicted membrane-bound dolichyl-phosphate-mannose-protein mannosyltransferase
MAPEKFDPEITFKINKHASNVVKEVRYRTYTREEVAELLNPTNTWEHQEPEAPPTVYPHLPREEAERLVREHFEYIENEKKRLKEYTKWDSAKTTESGQRTASTMRPSKSTKD